jgi:polyferredoxin
MAGVEGFLDDATSYDFSLTLIFNMLCTAVDTTVLHEPGWLRHGWCRGLPG